MKILLIALLSISFSVGSTEAATINLIATKDNTLIENVEGSFSNGAGEFLFVGKTDDSELRRAVLHFDIADAIPAGSTINSVILHLSVTRAANNKPASENVELHKLLASWEKVLPTVQEVAGLLQLPMMQLGFTGFTLLSYGPTPVAIFPQR